MGIDYEPKKDNKIKFRIQSSQHPRISPFSEGIACGKSTKEAGSSGKMKTLLPTQKNCFEKPHLKMAKSSWYRTV